ncbi:C40 family peptidase [Polaribacter sp.]|jgi:cell wall-associated NlpC family hydrolase|nr:C40 family peptidase [Polaribacter sp.]
MKLRVSLFLLLPLVFGCSVQNNNRVSKVYELKVPFKKKDYPDTNKSISIISNAKGTNLNSLKSQALADAQFNIAQRAISLIKSHLELQLSNSNELSESNTKLSSISKSNVFANKIKLVDTKSFIKENGKYEYWAVFSIDLDDVTKIINQKANLNLKEDFYKSVIDKDFKLTLDDNESQTNKKAPENILIETGLADKIIAESKKYIGVPYVWGGDDPLTGFDCSGYVQWVFNEAMGISIPRTSKQQYEYFKSKTAKSIKNIKPGDILFFRTTSSPVSHVGIAINSKTFIHAPNSNSKIRIDALEGYWMKKFIRGFNISDYK